MIPKFAASKIEPALRIVSPLFRELWLLSVDSDAPAIERMKATVIASCITRNSLVAMIGSPFLVLPAPLLRRRVCVSLVAAYREGHESPDSRANATTNGVVLVPVCSSATICATAPAMRTVEGVFSKDRTT